MVKKMAILVIPVEVNEQRRYASLAGRFIRRGAPE